MAHSVICCYCGRGFDRDKEKYVKATSRRYSHAKCAIENAEKNNLPIPEVITPVEYVNCVFCKKKLDKNGVGCIQLSPNRYAHLECASKPKTEKESLEEYIMELFECEYIPPRIQKQITQYIEQYHFTYSGIHKALTYFFEVKKNPVEKESPTLGIVPYCYKEAFTYYYSIWEAKQKNKGKSFEDYVPKEIVINISPPERKNRKQKVFSFLDEEEDG